jgi:hypothetical protein
MPTRSYKMEKIVANGHKKEFVEKYAKFVCQV